MNGQQVGYIRVSSIDQNTGRQLEGVELDKRFEEKRSGKDTKRPALQECLSYLREGDTLHVHSIDRLARNLSDLQSIVDGLTSRGVAVCFHKEGMTFDGNSDNPMNTLMLQMLGAFAQFERSMIRERQREGIAKAKAEGKMLGRQSKLTAEDLATMQALKEAGTPLAEIGRRFGMTRQGIYKALKRTGQE